MARKSSTKPAAPETTTPSAALAALRGMATVAPPKSGKDKKDRLVLELDDAETAMLEHYVEAVTVGKFFDDEQKANDSPLKERCLRKWCSLVWKNRAIPENPEVMAFRDGRQYARAILLVKNQFRPNHVVPSADQRNGRPVRQFLIDALTQGESGLTHDQAEELVDAEVQIEADLSIRLSSLLEGHYENNVWTPATPEQIKAGTKLVAWIQGQNPPPPTPDETAILLAGTDDRIRVKDSKGFLARAITYAKSVDQFHHIVITFKPDLAWSGVKFAENFPATENPRLKAAVRILGLEDQDAA